jgi:hypothetical protein
MLNHDGEPATLYHGTRHAFERFVPSTTGAEGPGIYMKDAPAEYGTITMELQVRMRNPYFFYSSDESLEADVNGELIEQVLLPELAAEVIDRMDRLGVEAYGTEVQDALKTKGHDGIVMVYPFGESVLKGANGACVVIAFDPEQVAILKATPKLAAKP